MDAVTLSILFSISKGRIENCKEQTIIETIPERIILKFSARHSSLTG